MIQAAMQIQPDYSLNPFSEEDLTELKAYKPNQVVNIKLTGCRKPRSYQQLKTYWGACRVVAENNETPGWMTQQQVSFQCKVALSFYDPDLVIAKKDGSIAVQYRSISYDNLKHMEACNYFNRALDIMACKIGVSVETLIENIGTH